jgi:hypothetical protein
MPLELAGKRFSRLLVTRRVKVEGSRNAMWEAICDCGNITVGAAANFGKTKFSCGCLRMESCTEILKGNTYQRTHNQSETVEHATWTKMKQRCHNPNNHKYPIYGGRGIFVCDEWRDSFEQFYADMGPRPSKRHSIDRKNNDGPYAPDNCHWALPKVQGRNTRTNHLVTIDGQTMCLIEWCEALGVPYWKPWEMIRGRGRERDLPPAYATIEDALRALYERKIRYEEE